MRNGDAIALDIEKPAVGGRMIGRVGGQIVLVSGAIPGEHVTARVERVGKGVVYAETVGVDRPSPDRRADAGDLACGGSWYACMTYPRQLDVKSLVVADAFGRIGRIVLPSRLDVTGSREDGYRMRARLHVRGRRIGFFRENTHDLCDPRATRQLLPETCDVLDRLAAAGVGAAQDIEVSENVDASERVVRLEPDDSAAPAVEGLTAPPYVTDVLTFADRRLTFRRHVQSFFQGNRFLIRDLVEHVVSLVPADATVVDLYAGAGLFSIAAAAIRGARVTAVEGDRFGAADLDANVQASGAAVTAVHDAVETFAIAQRDIAAVIVDPPRTGMSREAMDRLLSMRAGQVVYVSCDVATLARDARRLLDAGYTIDHTRAFDLFPNTPHVEVVVRFTS